MEKNLFFSKNLKTYLFANDIDPDDFAKQLGVSTHAIRLWVRQKSTPGQPTMMVLSNIMGVKADDLQNRDLTYRLIMMSGYTDTVMEPGDQQYAENSTITRLRNHLRKVATELSSLSIATKEVLDS